MADPDPQDGKAIDNWIAQARDLWARLVAWLKA